MSTGAALLQAILDDPDSDTPRLVYADWLDEHDQPIRAEFIRLQIDIAHKQATLPRVMLNRHVDLFRRNQELIDNHREELLGPLVALPSNTKIEFQRGFVSEMSLRVMSFHQHLRGLLKRLPHPRLIIEDSLQEVREILGFFVSQAYWEHHTHLVTGIRTLRFSFEDDPDLNTDLPASLVGLYPLHWPRVEELDISGCRLGDLNADKLIRYETFPTLTNLDLSENELTDTSVTTLLNSGLAAQLGRLIFGGNPIGDDGAVILAERWPTGAADKLEHLNMRLTNIGPRGQQALLNRFGGRVDLF